MTNKQLGNILIRNTQRTHIVTLPSITCTTRQILKHTHTADWDVSITFVNARRMKKLNTTYRGVPYATDILSFRFLDKPVPGKLKPEHGVKDLGEIYISVNDKRSIMHKHPVSIVGAALGRLFMPNVVKDATDLKQTIPKRLRTLLVHGLCHLQGYDHEHDAEARVMEAKERELLKKIEKKKS